MAEFNIKARTLKDKEGGAILRRVWELGYEQIAWNHTIFGKPTQANISNLPKLPHVLLDSDANVSLPLRRLSGCETNALTQHQRLTVIVDDFVDAQSLHTSNESLKLFDIVAATPSNIKVFNHLCREADIDIISIDFSRHLTFSIIKKTIDEAVKRGIYFEIKVGPCLFNSAHRRETFNGVKNLIRGLRGRNIILTSGVDQAAHLRGPYDIINIGKLLQLSQAQSHEAVYGAWRKVLQHAVSRRRRYHPVTLTTYQNLLQTLSDHENIHQPTASVSQDSISKKRKRQELGEDDGNFESEQPLLKYSPTVNDDSGLLMFD